MKSMVIGGIILVIALIAGTYLSTGDAFIGDDYINSLTMLGAIAIIVIVVFTVLKYVNQIKNDTASGELAEDNWDGIGEYRNNVPTGWALAFIGTIIWMFWYMTIGYPINGFSQIGQWNEETLEYNAKFEKKWENPSTETLEAMGQSTFLVQCSPCHGVDAEGIQGKAQNLTKRISKHQVVHVINNGSNSLKTAYPGGMPAGMAFGPDVDVIAEYVAGGFKGEQPAAFGVCAGCHGADGKGMPYVAPNIREYDDALVTAVLKDGKKSNIGTMPSFDGRLNETQQKAVAAYLRSLGE
ncbi:c-type cytochrome [Poseidonibacter antarcticus]|uniref:c-type cytochrome n=1 Tax=Poseidonibacter antarcticus TaxID=2478538 RepID=UPI000EF4EA4E|nr:c-type cytochrome [Poseidonibacter antarcticus]